MKRGLRRAVRWILLALLAMVLAYEEIQWRLAVVFALLGRLPLLHQLENWASRLPPYGALSLFVLPSLLILPFKLLAVYWLAGGHATLGISTIVLAKVTGTALVGRIFQLTHPSLLQIHWCRWVFDRIVALRAAAYAIWQRMPVVRWWRARWAKQKALGGFWARKWSALRQHVVKTR